MRRIVLLPLPLLAVACDSDCANPSRVNDVYAVWHSVANAPDGEAIDRDTDTASATAGPKAEGGDAVLTDSWRLIAYSMFINGWSKWDVTLASGGDASVEITDVAELQGDLAGGTPTPQNFTARMVSSDSNCNEFQLTMEGVFITPSDTSHQFTYVAQLVYLGDHVSGSFTYDDTFVGPQGSNLASGSITGARGDLFGQRQTDAVFDTGFGEAP
jgi:hypothetical protein